MTDANDNSSSSLPFMTEDLVAASKRHRQFLADLHRQGVTVQTSPSSVRRYLDCWIPLLIHHGRREQQEHPKRKDYVLIPPLDIAWVWYCDRLSPVEYTKRLNSEVDDDDEHEFSSCFTFQDPSDPHDPTIQAWNKMCPNENFFLQPNSQHPDEETRSTASECVTDKLKSEIQLLHACQSQARMLYQISGLQYQDDVFLQEAVRRYLLFLKLPEPTDDDNESSSSNNSNHQGNSQRRHCMIIPTNAIDWIWHTHMASSPFQYIRDCVNVRGSVLLHVPHHHDDSQDQDESAERNMAHKQQSTDSSSRQRAWDATLRLWSNAYPTVDYLLPGDHNYGDPPPEYFTNYQTWELNQTMTPITSTCSSSPQVKRQECHQKVHVGCVSGSLSVSQETFDSANATQSASFISAGLARAAKLDQQILSQFPRREGYMFGMGPSGLGYYSLRLHDNPCLPDALMIMSRRLKHSQQSCEAHLHLLDTRCCLCGLFGRVPDTFKHRRDDLEREITRLAGMRRTLMQAVKKDLPATCSPKQNSHREHHKRHDNDSTAAGPIALVLLTTTQLPPVWMTESSYADAAACGGITMPLDDDGAGAGCGDADCCADCCYF